MSTIGMLSAWIAAARPKTWIASLAPVMIAVSIVCSERNFEPIYALLVAVDALLLQIGANFANDVLDFERGADTSARLGPVRLTSAGVIKPQHMKLATAVVLGCAFLLGIPLVARGGLSIVLIGIAAIVTAVAYSGGPFPLAYHGLGEVATMVFFGVLAPWGTAHITALTVPFSVVVLGFCPGLISIALLTVNNLRDQNEDRLTGKRTLIVRFGRRFGVAEYVFCMLASVLIPVLLDINEWPVLLLIPFVLVLCRKVAAASNAHQWGKVLSGTGGFFVVYTVGLVGSLVWW